MARLHAKSAPTMNSIVVELIKPSKCIECVEESQQHAAAATALEEAFHELAVNEGAAAARRFIHSN